jgi:phage-related protein (TIGR01555 family)
MANPITAVRDSFKNLVSNLGTSRDKQTGGDYYLTNLTDDQLSAIYRTSWMGRKVVDIPAKDATRKWREWEAESDQIKKIEAEEAKHMLPQKVKKALQLARLYGGSAIYFSIENDDPELPLQASSVSAGGLSFVTVMPKSVLGIVDTETDPMSDRYGKPAMYEVGSTDGTTQRVHPSRLAVFIGEEVLDSADATGGTDGWGDSVLQSAYEAVRNADSTASNIASLVYEAKVDILQIPDLTGIMSNERSRAALEQRVQLSAQLKGNNGMMIIDGEEEYHNKSYNFSGLPEISYQALQAVSGAADIPITRFLGQSPAGLNSTGESDLQNYYDGVNSMQNLTITPAMAVLDEVLVRSALGDRPEDVSFQWSSLWQMSDKQKSSISKETADTIKTLVETGLFHEDDLAMAAANVLVEHSILPSFELSNTPSVEEDDEL